MEKQHTGLPFVLLLGIKIIRYRIVRDCYLGFKCQKWRIWFPFWVEIGSNTHTSYDDAFRYINNNSKSKRNVIISS